MPLNPFVLLTLSQLPLPARIEAQLYESPSCRGSALSEALNLSVADTPEKRSRGLSGPGVRLKKNHGMIFVFGQPQPVKFWMKDTHLALSIGFFGVDSKLITTLEMPVEKNPSRPLFSYGPEADQPVAFAIETANHELDSSKSKPVYLCYRPNKNLNPTTTSNKPNPR